MVEPTLALQELELSDEDLAQVFGGYATESSDAEVAPCEYLY